MKTKIGILSAIILAAAFTRLIPHPYNFAPITAMALFGGAHFSNKFLSFFVPLASLFLSDLIIGFYPGMWVIYGSFMIIVCIGLWLRTHRSALAIASATLVGSVLFFLITNFSVWALGTMYSKTISGLMTCYIAAIPFFQNTLLGDAFYSVVLFGGYALAQKYVSSLREPTIDIAHI